MSAAVGIDVSTKKIALALYDRETRLVVIYVLWLNPKWTGARRLREAREAVWMTLDAHRGEVGIVLVEIPWARQRSSYALLAMAGVASEAAQAALPGAVVMEVPTSTWKQQSVGFGNATKEEVMEHSRTLGYDGDDQDVADALCIAQCAAARWASQQEGAA